MAPTTAPRRVRTGRTGSLASTKKSLWAAISRTRDALFEAENHGQIISATHALSQDCSAYSHLVEAGELEARLKASIMGSATLG